MTPESYLEQYRAAAREIRFLDSEMERLEPACRSPSLSPVRVQGGESLPPDAQALNAMERRDRLLARKNDLLALQKEIEQVIESLPEPLHRELLTLRYIHGLKYWQIGETMNYSRSHLDRLHNAALVVISEKMGHHET